MPNKNNSKTPSKKQKKALDKGREARPKGSYEKTGRPTKMTSSTLDKLHLAFNLGCTDNQACLYANIAPDTLYNYQKANPEYIKQKELWKENPVLEARKSVISGITKDPNLALKFLERKVKSEFSLRHEHTGEDGVTLLPSNIIFKTTLLKRNEY